jgi:hypothetical protein
MKIQFKLIDSQCVKIIGIDEKTKEEKEIGEIFTPSSSGHSIKNAIQMDLKRHLIYGDALYMK